MNTLAPLSLLVAACALAPAAAQARPQAAGPGSRLKKNQTDGADSVPQINFRYIPALTIPITTTLKPFLAKKGASAADVERMHAAWVKSVLLQSILWSQPYVRAGEF